jgi:hypothetical protein
MNSKTPASSNSAFLRPLGAFEELFWLLDQQRPVHFVMAAEVDGHTTVDDWLRERARQEGTTVHGALSAAFAVACWEIFGELNDSPIRVMSPIDTRKLLELGEECAMRVGSGTVPIESCEATTFWDIARLATTGLTKAQTLEAIRTTRHGMHEVFKPGLDVPTAAAIAAQGFAHDILLTNVGNLGYGTDFGELELKAVWGPAVTARLVSAHTIGVTTINGSLRLVQTTFAPAGSLLESVEKILVSVCATRKHVMVAQLRGRSAATELVILH